MLLTGSSRTATAILVLAAVTVTRPAAADADAQACIEAHTTAVQQRQQHQLKSARQQFIACAQPHCPEVIRNDCDEAARTLRNEIPSIVLGATRDGADVVDCRVYADGVLLADGMTGTALTLDPRAYRMRFDCADAGQAELSVVVRQGEKNRRVVVALEPAAASVEGGWRMPTAAWVFGGIGVAALAVFAGFAIDGTLQENALASCRGQCSNEQFDAMLRSYIIADVALGMGLVSIGSSAVLAVALGGQEPNTVGLRLSGRF